VNQVRQSGSCGTRVRFMQPGSRGGDRGNSGSYGHDVINIDSAKLKQNKITGGEGGQSVGTVTGA
jgi:hypothetical protein